MQDLHLSANMTDSPLQISMDFHLTNLAYALLKVQSDEQFELEEGYGEFSWIDRGNPDYLRISHGSSCGRWWNQPEEIRHTAVQRIRTKPRGPAKRSPDGASGLFRKHARKT